MTMLTKKELQDKIKNGLRFLDGATGSNLRLAGMPKGCCAEQWILENPQPLVKLQRAYAESGSQIIYAPTFQAQPIALEQVGLAKDSVVLLEQIRTIDKQRLKEKMGHLDDFTMNNVNSAIEVSFGLSDTEITG